MSISIPAKTPLLPGSPMHSLEVVDGVDNGLVLVPAFEGAQFLDLNGSGRGRLTQTFATTPGSLYTLTFAYANNFYADPSSTVSAAVQVFDGLGASAFSRGACPCLASEKTFKIHGVFWRRKTPWTGDTTNPALGA